ncbi:P-loop containing nucleoside triphosphate hydrolase protein [Infundibulicybe gibba]|nr:P-loop containing nucleoside triphosphate hydrolase protein [Infundibulicybe gibba]
MIMSPNKRLNFKITIVGDGAIGKTSLCTVFATGNFPEIYTPVVCENYTCDVVPMRADRLRPLCYADVDAILLCFAVNNQDSFENIEEKWSPELNHYCPAAPVILGDRKEIDELARIDQRFVTLEEAMEIAQRRGAREYRECSAKTGTGVHEAFEAAASEALRIRNRKSTVRKLTNQCVIL